MFSGIGLNSTLFISYSDRDDYPTVHRMDTARLNRHPDYCPAQSHRCAVAGSCSFRVQQ